MFWKGALAPGLAELEPSETSRRRRGPSRALASGWRGPARPANQACFYLRCRPEIMRLVRVRRGVHTRGDDDGAPEDGPASPQTPSPPSPTPSPSPSTRTPRIRRADREQWGFARVQATQQPARPQRRRRGPKDGPVAPQTPSPPSHRLSLYLHVSSHSCTVVNLNNIFLWVLVNSLFLCYIILRT